VFFPFKGSFIVCITRGAAPVAAPPVPQKPMILTLPNVVFFSGPTSPISPYTPSLIYVA